VDDPDMDAADIAVAIVNSSVNYFAKHPVKAPVTLAALDLSKADDVAARLDALAQALTAQLPARLQAIFSAQMKSARFLGDQLCDIGNFCSRLGRTLKDVGAAAANAQKGTETREDGFVIASRSIGKAVARAGGVSIYLPPLTPVSTFYPDLEYAKRGAWARFLGAYCGG
jgi:adenosylmethionine-8-amino-7-oxononanoate aminotransferase